MPENVSRYQAYARRLATVLLVDTPMTPAGMGEAVPSADLPVRLTNTPYHCQAVPSIRAHLLSWCQSSLSDDDDYYVCSLAVSALFSSVQGSIRSLTADVINLRSLPIL